MLSPNAGSKQWQSSPSVCSIYSLEAAWGKRNHPPRTQRGLKFAICEVLHTVWLNHRSLLSFLYASTGPRTPCPCFSWECPFWLGPCFYPSSQIVQSWLEWNHLSGVWDLRGQQWVRPLWLQLSGHSHLCLRSPPKHAEKLGLFSKFYSHKQLMFMLWSNFGKVTFLIAAQILKT